MGVVGGMGRGGGGWSSPPLVWSSYATAEDVFSAHIKTPRNREPAAILLPSILKISTKNGKDTTARLLQDLNPTPKHYNDYIMTGNSTSLNPLLKYYF